MSFPNVTGGVDVVRLSDLWSHLLRQRPEIFEAHVLARDDRAGRNRFTAFLVPAFPFESVAFIREANHQNPHLPALDAAVQLPVLPRDAAGRVCTETLSDIPVFDPEDPHLTHARLAFRPSPTQTTSHEPAARQGASSDKGAAIFAVTLENKHVPEKPLSISQLLPHLTPTKKANIRRSAPSEQPAFCDGGPLTRPTRPSLIALLQDAARDPQQGYLHLSATGATTFQSYADTLAEARCILAGLRKKGCRAGEPVILQIDNSRAFWPTLWGCVLGGIIPVPVTVAPTYDQDTAVLRKLVHAWDMLDQPPVLVSGKPAQALPEYARRAGLEAMACVPVTDLAAHPPSDEIHPAHTDTPAVFLLTSGSTGKPKAVPLTHGNLMAMTGGTIQMNGFTREDVTLNWMPLDHVGVIGFLGMTAVDLGCSQVHVPTDWILKAPLRWLELIETHRATISWAPNFAFNLINEQAESLAQRRFDLSSMTFLVNAGEANVASTMRHFVNLLGEHGLPADAMHPAFGMSETCSGITWRGHFGPDQMRDDQPFVRLGPPIPGAQLRFVNEDGTVLREGEIGLLQVSGSSVTHGYYRNAEQNRESFKDGWFTTGDLGYLEEGELVITGRKKDDIVINGVNFYCHEIEAVVEAHADVTVSYTAVCAVRDADRAQEDLAVFFNTNLEGTARDGLFRAIRGAVAKNFGLVPKYLIPLETEAVPKTAIGKIQRGLLKQRFEDGLYRDLVNQEQDIDDQLPDMMVRPVWRAAQQAAVPLVESAGPLLVFADQQGLADSIVPRLMETGPVITVRREQDAVQADHHVNPADAASVTALRAALEQQGAIPARWLILWPVDPGPDDPADTSDGLTALFTLVRDLVNPGTPLQIKVAAVGADPEGEAPFEPAKATLAGFLASLPRETAGSATQLIHLARDVQNHRDALITECHAPITDPIVRFHKGAREIQRLKKRTFSADERTQTGFVKGGFYVVTGGLGGVGRHFCRRLIEQYDAKLLILGRTNADNPETRAALEELKGQTAYASVDLGDNPDLHNLITEQGDQWNQPLNGILHLAGGYHFRTVAEEDVNGIHAVLAPKVTGTLALHKVAAAHPGCLFLAVSSVNAWFGGARLSAYAAAGSFLEQFTAWQRTQGIDARCLSFSAWTETGMSQGLPIGETLRHQGFQALTPRQGLAALELALAYDAHHLLVGVNGNHPAVRMFCAEESLPLHTPTVFAARTTEGEPVAPTWIDPFGNRFVPSVVTVEDPPLNADGTLDVTRLLQAHRNQSNKHQAPRNAVEETLCAIWRDLLKQPINNVFANFFELGGQSINALTMVARIQEQLQVSLPVDRIFAKPILSDIAELIAGASTESELPALTRADRTQPLPLSPGQERLWIIDRMEGSRATYNETLGLRLRGELDVARLRRALGEVVARHEILRTGGQTQGNQTVQLIVDRTDHGFTYYDLSDLAAGDRDQALADLKRETAQTPFDLSQAPLFRVALVRLGVEDSVLLLVAHHMIIDGHALGLMLSEWSRCYNALADDDSFSLGSAPFQYADYSVWLRNQLQGDLLEQQTAFWRKTLADAPPLLQLPTDHVRPATPSHRGGMLPFTLDADLVTRLQDKARAGETTLYLTLAAAFNMLLARHAGVDDVVIGAPFANRPRPEMDAILGFFTNVLVLRTSLADDPDFDTVLRRVHKVASDAYAHQLLPFETMVAALNPERDLGFNPWVQVVFELQNEPMPVPELNGITAAAEPFFNHQARVDLELHLWQNEGRLEGWFLFALDLFEPARIEAMAARFQALLRTVLEAPQQPLSALTMLTEADHAALAHLDQSKAETGEPVCIHTLFARQAAATPTAPALTWQNETLDYQSLNARADDLAGTLAEMGVAAETTVACLLPRGADAVVALLAVLKTGAIYLPLDANQPEERLSGMLEDSEASFVLTLTDWEDQVYLPFGMVFCMDRDWEPGGAVGFDAEAHAVTPDAPAYMIYTSGSTGRPKGTLLGHAGFTTMIQQQIKTFGIGPGDRVAWFANPAFDAALSEITMALLSGACLLPVPTETQQDPSAFVAFMREQRISAITLPPSYLRGLNRPAFDDLKVLISAGEAAQAEDARYYAERLQFFNAYGPTEYSVCATIHRVRASENTEQGVPIGRPIAGTHALLLDGDTPVPPGVVGELCLRGPGCALGYHNRPERTEHAFPTDAEGRRFYRTGDLARLTADGNLIFVGRKDHQVKVRGYRVELGEVEHALTSHPTISQASVVATQDADGNTTPAAYYTFGSRLELWPSVAEFFIYDDTLYHTMAAHEQRNQCYQRAFAKVLPGKTVVEIGPGPEVILSRLALEAGATHVTAIEYLEETYLKAKQRVAELGLEDRITLIHGNAMEVDLPEKVDYCISEIVGSIGGSEGAAKLINDARRFLHNPSHMIPERSATRIAAVSLEEGLDMAFPKAAASYVERIFADKGYRFDLRLCLKNAGRRNLLSDDGIFEELQYTEELPLEHEHPIKLTFHRDGRCHGFLVWLTLFPDEQNGLDTLESQESWLPLYLPLPHDPIEVAAGDVFRGTVRRTLCDNGLNPDYRVSGTLEQADGGFQPIEVVSFHHKAVYRATPFYKSLLGEETVPVRPTLAASEVRAHLAKQLPDYMVPAHFIELARLPLTANGKIDRKALPSPRQAAAASQSFEAPAGAVEQTVAEIWCAVLERPRVGRNEHFLEIGGHSLSLIQVHQQLETRFGPTLTMVEMFQYPTVRAQAEQIAQRLNDTAPPETPANPAPRGRTRSLSNQRNRRTRNRNRD
ncbi:non-ribosomal peptide synthetase [Acanthopleuribacter pedis]|uniref:Amino acid adenylation domain-containing protein n=1 Tax=Acanthopleuribacter pedis TaxID=442870 RepID=A0A8J7U3T2_9BACT|nr:non-ribosomal peptide synthetase [Acanthopleuribacter pedis]MBO1317351.1 amino acid adenylation domain-containing protein [Acanthopleuribacter pedis]MBO1318658.1 amino acid adenylation domain-containing protein [Acanthopleuribacter pedis]